MIGITTTLSSTLFPSSLGTHTRCPIPPAVFFKPSLNLVSATPNAPRAAGLFMRLVMCSLMAPSLFTLSYPRQTQPYPKTPRHASPDLPCPYGFYTPHSKLGGLRVLLAGTVHLPAYRGERSNSKPYVCFNLNFARANQSIYRPAIVVDAQSRRKHMGVEIFCVCNFG